jgi:carbon-monoxide dehydrogenase small subunit
MTAKRVVNLEINGGHRAVNVPAAETLLETLRALGHVEVKSGCEKGDCGACAVLLDGVAIDSCLTLTWMAEGRAITTVNGLGGPDAPHALQEAFIRLGAVQCGYCTPGLIVAAQSLLHMTPEPSDDDLRIALSGNLCRCTGYRKVFAAVHDAVARLREDGAAR